jgi:hypothetical protein
MIRTGCGVGSVDGRADPPSRRRRHRRVRYQSGDIVNVDIVERPSPFGFAVTISSEVASPSPL